MRAVSFREGNAPNFEDFLLLPRVFFDRTTMCPQPTLWRHEKVVFVELLKVFEVCLILALGPKDLERPRWEDFLGRSDLIGSYSLGGIWAPPDDAPKFSLVAESVLEASFLKTPKSLSDQNPVY